MELRPLLESLTILTKDLELVPFKLNWAQERMLEIVERQLATTGRIRIIILKARQLGMSTFTEALLFVLSFINSGYRCAVVAHEVPASQNLLAMTRRYWDNYPYKDLYTPNNLSRNDLGWVETGSHIHVATAGNKAVGRSATVHGLHASEVAFWPEPRIAFLGLRQTVPDTTWSCIVLESTANGVGDFFNEQWNQAVAGETEYEALFLPWHEHPEYLASVIGVPFDNLGHLDAEEKSLRAMGLSDDRLAWRRWAIRNKCQNDVLQFHQEYPTTPEEAFLSSGNNIFPAEPLRACYDPHPGYKGILLRNGNQVTFHAVADGRLTIFSLPNPDPDVGRYIIGGDPTHTTTGDYACAQVLNRRTLEQVAVLRVKMDPGTFAEEMAKLGRFYNDALLCPEIEGPGYMTVGKLHGMNYPNIYRKVRPDSSPGKVSTEQYGWSTTAKSKHLAIGWTIKHVVDQTITIHDRFTFEEMTNYVRNDAGSYSNANGSDHDDTVMALAIALTCNELEGPLPPVGLESADPLPELRQMTQPGRPEVLYGDETDPLDPFTDPDDGDEL